MTDRSFIKILSGILLICITSGGFAQGLSFSLQEARDYAVKNNYEVKNARYDVEMARRRVKENLAYGFPQIDGSVEYNYYPALPTSLIPGDFFGQPGEYVELQFGTKNNLNASITLNQLIFDGRYFIGLQYAKISEQVSLEGLEKSSEDVIETVTQTYFNILVGEEALRVLDSTLAVLQKIRYETGELLKEGFVELTDYDQLTLTVMDIENSINSVKRQNIIGYKLLNYQMGIEMDQQVILTESLDDLIEMAGSGAILEEYFNLEQHIDYRLISSQEQIKVLGLQNERAAYYPSLNGFFFVQENAQRDNFTFFNSGEPWFLTAITGVTLQVPIFSSGLRKHRVGQAKVDLEKIRNTKYQVAEGLKLNITQARSEFRTALENFFREKQNVQLSKNIYDRTLIKYNEGLATSVELTQQHNQFFDAQRKYFQIVLSLLDSKNKLDKALGKY